MGPPEVRHEEREGEDGPESGTGVYVDVSDLEPRGAVWKSRPTRHRVLG